MGNFYMPSRVQYKPEVLGQMKEREDKGRIKVSFNDFTPNAIEVLVASRTEAVFMSQNVITTLQIFSGIFRDKGSLVCQLLSKSSINFSRIRYEIGLLSGDMCFMDEDFNMGTHFTSYKVCIKQIPVTPEVIRLLSLAKKYSKKTSLKNKSKKVSVEHILLALLEDRKNLCSTILIKLGTNPRKLKSQIKNYLKEDNKIGENTHSSALDNGEYHRKTTPLTSHSFNYYGFKWYEPLNILLKEYNLKLKDGKCLTDTLMSENDKKEHILYYNFLKDLELNASINGVFTNDDKQEYFYLALAHKIKQTKYNRITSNFDEKFEFYRSQKKNSTSLTRSIFEKDLDTEVQARESNDEVDARKEAIRKEKLLDFITFIKLHTVKGIKKSIDKCTRSELIKLNNLPHRVPVSLKELRFYRDKKGKLREFVDKELLTKEDE